MKISLVGLDEGLHQLSFKERPAACGVENHPNIRTDVHIDVRLERGTTHLYLFNKVRTVGTFNCDRCLDEIEVTLSEEGRTIFSSDSDLVNDSENDIYPFIGDAREIDITDEIRDLLLLSIPSKILCSKDCKGLCSGCGANLNVESCRCEAKPIDSRWEALLKLKKSM